MMNEVMSGMMNGMLATAAGAPEQPPFYLQILPMILIFGIFYFFMIRPQTKARKEQEAMIAAIKSGDDIITTGGILGTVTNVKEKTVVVRIADNVKIELLKTNIFQVEKPKTSEVK